jgi:drug/metabolite transporter (DMT)-like permease
MQKPTQAHIALLGANLFYGIGFSVAKMVMPSLIQPSAFILIRVVCAAILFWASWFFGKNFRATIARKDWLRLFVCAMFGVVINMLLFFKGLSLTSPIHGSLMMLSTPVLVTLLASAIAAERITSNKIIGLLIAVAGAIILILSRSTEAIAVNAPLGDLYIFINACSYALYLVLVKPLMQQYRPIIIIRWIFLIGSVFVIPFGWSDLQQITASSFATADWLAVIFIVLGVTFCTYLWNIFAIQHLSSSIAGAYIYLQPLFAALISVFFFGEQFTLQKLVAAVLIFSGVALATRAKLQVVK